MEEVDGLELTTDFEQLQGPNSLHNTQKKDRVKHWKKVLGHKLLIIL